MLDLIRNTKSIIQFTLEGLLFRNASISKRLPFVLWPLMLLACGVGTPTNQAPTQAQDLVIPEDSAHAETSELVAPTDTADQPPTHQPQAPTPTTAASVPPTDSIGDVIELFYNLPQAILTEATGMYVSPNRSELVVQVQIPPGDPVFVMGRNATSTHLRVVWNTGVGWIPVSFTDYNAARERLSALPVFKHEPPACAIPLTTQFSLNSNWTSASDQRQRIAAVVDLFRTRFGDFPPSHLSLTVNGQVVDSTRRQIVEQGQFTLKDVVFTLPGYVQQGDTVGYLLETASDEPLSFMVTIFSVPENCVWDTE